MDTVPVLNDTKNLWTHEPWSGHIDEEGGAIWGRGSSDAKSSLIGILEAVEILLEGGTSPSAPSSLLLGAAKLSEFIMEHLGLENKVGMIVDEGSGISEQLGAELAMVSVAEKGYYDAIVTIKTPVVTLPCHLTIHAVVALEANPHPLSLPDNSPYLQSLVCLARYSPKIDPWLKFAIEHISEFRTAVISALSSAIDSRYLMTTSQAVDIISGGHKVNALPEVVSFLVNHRVAFDSSSTLLEARLMKILKPVAAKHNLNLTLVPADPSSPPVTVTVPSDVTAHGSMSIKPYAPALEPAPVSPSFGDAAYETLAGTIMHVLAPKGTGKVVKPEPGKEDLNFAVSPMLMPANTDTRHYWRLTRNIYRFGPYRKLGGIHTVDEYITQDSFLEGVAFFHELIRNWKTSDQFLYLIFPPFPLFALCNSLSPEMQSLEFAYA
ncbi:hypothetical protein BC829DRAFT_416764 [Chytridium lagenaria]|nr:hypothetical protein BC829DRAFT_416764 [Chytridium lagenaria]